MKRLQEIQEIEGLRTGNKLTTRHLNFHNKVMKVKLASQLLSNSVAQSLHLAKYLLPESCKFDPTVEFLKYHNDILDDLNSKGDPKAYDLKNALKRKTKLEIFELIENYKEYIANLKVKNYNKKDNQKERSVR